MAPKKSALLQQLEDSIRLAKKGKFRKPDALLADRLRKMENDDLPDSLTCPICKTEPCDCES